ncbi:electron transport complex subunit RsxC [Candidatus Solincola tengchongensis]|uniref:electron transport complex subunit RsxC n=1 Tax=Candidatus Solincola tengchongensis TaxID=2900693 RepID=UPI00257A8BB9|nr:electron transport complex subunit RsxC [Candidatus Solincola tengchongensis]
MGITVGIRTRRGKRVKGGVHPPESKHLTADKPIVRMEAPELVTIPLRQHVGAPCSPRVKRGDRVLVGTLIGDSEAFVSAPVHSSVSGTVRGIAPHPHPAGGESPAVTIENDGLYERDPSLRPLEWRDMEPDEIRRAVRAAGMVGLGGAAFPTHVKLAPPKEFPIHTVILNGAECEPFLTADYRLMLEHPEDVVEGLRIIMSAVGAHRAIIAVEDNKPLAVKKLAEVVRDPSIELRTLKTRYPQGAEKVLITNLLGREVPSGGLPMHVGVVVNNVGTARAIAQYFRTGLPLVERVVTVTGSVIREPSNLLVPLGSSFAAAVEACGGFSASPAKVIMGGPMMGLAQYTLEVPVVKGTSGILALSDREAAYEVPREPVCIRCGRCVEVCPMNLIPTYLAAFSHREKWDQVRRLNINDCIECGCCTYTCPTRNPIVQLIKVGKAELARLKTLQEQRAREREEAMEQGGRDGDL